MIDGRLASKEDATFSLSLPGPDLLPSSWLFYVVLWGCQRSSLFSSQVKMSQKSSLFRFQVKMSQHLWHCPDRSVLPSWFASSTPAPAIRSSPENPLPAFLRCLLDRSNLFQFLRYPSPFTGGSYGSGVSLIHKKHDGIPEWVPRLPCQIVACRSSS
jgi:hypothetical protein